MILRSAIALSMPEHRGVLNRMKTGLHTSDNSSLNQLNWSYPSMGLWCKDVPISPKRAYKGNSFVGAIKPKSKNRPHWLPILSGNKEFVAFETCTQICPGYLEFFCVDGSRSIGLRCYPRRGIALRLPVWTCPGLDLCMLLGLSPTII